MIHIVLKKNDSYPALFVTLYFIMDAANLFVKLYLKGLPMWGILSKGVLFLAIVPAIMVVLIRKKDLNIFVLLEIFILSLLLFTYLRGKASHTFLKNSIYILGIYLPIGCCVGVIRDKEEVFRSLYQVRFIAHAMLLITLVAFTDGVYDYSMPASYALLFWALMTADHFMNVYRKKIDFFLLLLDITVIFFKGSRGALLCFLVYIFFTAMMKNRGLFPKKIYLSILVIGGIAAVIIMNQLSIFKAIYSWMLRHGYQSRIMWTLANNLFYDSGRISIYRDYLEKISDNALFGYGFLGGIEERMSIPHNLILETIFYFGIPIGIVFLIWYFYYFFKRCDYQKNSHITRLMMITFSILISTLFSNELFLSPFFYIGMVMILSEKKTGNNLPVAMVCVPCMQEEK